MIIRGAEVEGRRCDVRLAGGLVAEIGNGLRGDVVIDAGGGALLPGLHDHHIHLDAAAAAMQSVDCAVADLAALARVLAGPGEGWVRGVGFHDSIGRVDRDWLDAHGPDRPVRIQHRGGRMWVMNSRAMALIGGGVPVDGRLVDGDALVAARLGRAAPDLLALGRKLAAYGITGVTEVTPRNDAADFARYAGAGMVQRLLVMGGDSLDRQVPVALARVGAVKLHYHDHDLPGLDDLAAEVARAHGAGRAVAAHCVTRGELMLTLAAIEMAGADARDRIEHAGVAPDEVVEWVARLGITVVTQPHFLVARGAAYLREVAAEDVPYLYRLQGWRDAGVRLAAGSDAPFGDLNPWAAMAAAVERPAGFGDGEDLSAEAALGLFLGGADDPGGAARRVEVGAVADLCLIDREWGKARTCLKDVEVRATIVGGVLVYGGAE